MWAQPAPASSDHDVVGPATLATVLRETLAAQAAVASEQLLLAAELAEEAQALTARARATRAQARRLARGHGMPAPGSSSPTGATPPSGER